MIYIKTPGKKLWGYRCGVCGQEILSDEELKGKDLDCSCCGSKMTCTNIPKQREKDTEGGESSGGG